MRQEVPQDGDVRGLYSELCVYVSWGVHVANLQKLLNIATGASASLLV